MAVRHFIRTQQWLSSIGVDGQHKRFEGVAQERRVRDHTHDRMHVRQEHQVARVHYHSTRPDCAQECSVLDK